MQQSTKPDRLQPPCGGITPPAGRSPVTIQEINGRFACVACGYEWSAMAGDDEVPAVCSCQRESDPIVSKDRLSIDDDYGSETFIRTIDCETLLGLRNAVRELNCGHIPIYSDYDCTGLVCGQWCKFIKIYKTSAGYCAVVEITVSRDV